jgi:hypothetical protein
MSDMSTDAFDSSPADPTDDLNLRLDVSESWCCVDCGVNTAPDLLGRVEMEQYRRMWAARYGEESPVEYEMEFDERCEVYIVRDAVWRAAGMEPWGGCLCVGCLERRLGRTLTPRDFLRGDQLNEVPGTERLIALRDGT